MEEFVSDRSYRVNGFCQTESSVLDPSDSRFDGLSLKDLYIDEGRIEPYLIESVSDLLAVVENLESSYRYPLFYRAHPNINYINIPSSLRSSSGTESESWAFSEFQRRCPEVFDRCTNTLERLVVMQHYGSFSRCLDLAESPLIALAFACLEDKKYQSKKNDNNKRFASITVFRPETDEDVKPYSSSTASVISNCAMCESSFKYGHLEMKYKSDGFSSVLDNFIYFRDIIRRSVFVRTKQDNPRIRNQRGAFILANANELVDLNDLSTHVSVEYFNEYFLEKKDDPKFPLNIARLKSGEFPDFGNGFRKCNEWDFSFKKVSPYDVNNTYKEFQDDPFDLERLYFKGKTGRKMVFFIPPKAKIEISRQLENIGITYDFLYPEVDTVFHVIATKI